MLIITGTYIRMHKHVRINVNGHKSIYTQMMEQQKKKSWFINHSNTLT